MGFFSDLFESEETREKDRKAQALRNAEMKRRKKKEDEENAARLAHINKEIAMIREQDNNRKKKGWL